MRQTLFCSVCLFCFALTVMLSPAARSIAAEPFGLTPGPVELQSAGPMAFGPANVLFIGNPKAAKLYAIDTSNQKSSSDGDYAVKDLSAALSNAFGGGEVEVADLAVNPETGSTFLTVAAGDHIGLAKVTSDGTVSKVSLDKIGNTSVALPNAPEDKVVRRGRRSSNPRTESITDLAYVEGRLLVSGLSASESPSTVREFEFPFRETSAGMQVEIYHAAHGQREDNRAIQTFIPFTIDGQANVLAGYTCTPLVKIPVGNLKDNTKVSGTTVAELGNRNRPLDMIAYKQNGKDYLLIANSARGVMKVSTDNLAENEGLTEKVERGATAGQPYETIESLQGVTQLDKLNGNTGLVIVQQEGQPMSMSAIELP